MGRASTEERQAQANFLSALAADTFTYEQTVAMLAKAAALMTKFELERMLAAVEMDLDDLSV